MSSSQGTPKAVVQNIARARSLLKRDETCRALEALHAGLDGYDRSKLPGKTRFEVEVLIEECVSELNRQPAVRSFLEKLTNSSKVGVAYTPGKEDKLAVLLPILYKALKEVEASKLRSVVAQKEDRKNALSHKGVLALKEGDSAKAKATFRVLCDEFGHEPGVLAEVGQRMYDAGLFYEAAEFFEQSIEMFPKDNVSYAGATSSYITLREFEKAEEVYLKAIKVFGKHTKTYTNLANLYVTWNKKEKAYEAAQVAVTLDPLNEEAKALMDELT